MYDVGYVKTRTNRGLSISGIHSSPVLNQVASVVYDEKKSADPQETQHAM